MAGARREKIRQELERLRGILASHPAVIKVIVFGSAVRGGPLAVNDIDLIIVGHIQGRFLERLDKMYRLLQPRLACDLLVYTPEEFERLQNESTFVARAVREGVCLYAT